MLFRAKSLPAGSLPSPLRLLLRFASVFSLAVAAHAADPMMESFERDVQPVLDQYCYDCHGYGSDKGGVVLDGFDSAEALRDHKLWLRALKNVRAHIMPPADEEPLPPEAAETLVTWIKRQAFALDPEKPDPGRVTVRRLNRVEYRNTIRELTGVDYDTQVEFPADDTGHGFDNIGDVLTISPMLMEKYLDAAQSIVMKAVPTQPRVVAEKVIAGRDFVTVEQPADAVEIVDTETGPKPAGDAAKTFLRPKPTVEGKALDLSFYTPVTVATTHQAPHAGKYQVVVNMRAVEKYVDDQFDLNECKLIIKSDGETLLERDFVREGDKSFTFTLDREWKAGAHDIAVEVQPKGPDRPQPRLLRLRLRDVT